MLKGTDVFNFYVQIPDQHVFVNCYFFLFRSEPLKFLVYSDNLHVDRYNTISIYSGSDN